MTPPPYTTRRLRVAVVIILVAELLLIWVGTASGLRVEIYSLPFTLALMVLAGWNWNRWRRAKKAQQGAEQHLSRSG